MLNKKLNRIHTVIRIVILTYLYLPIARLMVILVYNTIFSYYKLFLLNIIFQVLLPHSHASGTLSKIKPNLS
jgi:hypothetical protein